MLCQRQLNIININVECRFSLLIYSFFCSHSLSPFLFFVREYVLCGYENWELLFVMEFAIFFDLVFLGLYFPFFLAFDFNFKTYKISILLIEHNSSPKLVIYYWNRLNVVLCFNHIWTLNTINKTIERISFTSITSRFSFWSLNYANHLSHSREKQPLTYKPQFMLYHCE